MIDLCRKQDNRVCIYDVEYTLDLSFDNVLRLFELINDDNVPDELKGYVALEMLTGSNLSDIVSVRESVEMFESIMNKYVNVQKHNDVQYDRLGNVIPTVKKEDEDEKRLYSLQYDGDYIYSSFLQAYGIDLVEVQGELTWCKFIALLNGLPEGTKLVEVIKIRAWQPVKGDSERHKRRMKELKKQYQLPVDTVY